MGDDDKNDERKEKVIHTRISESLDEEIRKKASNLGVSVSNLVRNVLVNAFGLVEEIVADSQVIARSARSAHDDDEPRSAAAHARRREPSEGRILGWQSFVLNLNAICEQCNTVLTKGSQAAVAVRDGAGPRTIICPRCLEEVSHGNGTPESST